jgi:hypothetical protein
MRRRKGCAAFGWAPQLREQAFFLASRSFGGEVTKYPTLLQANLGFRTDAFTFAAEVEDSRVVNFTYRVTEPGKTVLMINPLPPAL